jgi:hypothetical protein
MDDGAAVDLGFCPAQNFARDWGRVPLPESQVREQVDNRVPLRPIEVHDRLARRSFGSSPGERTHLQLAITNRVRSIPANHPG